MPTLSELRLEKLKREKARRETAAPVEQPKEDWENADPTGSFGENVLVGAGKNFTDMWLGARQLAAKAGLGDEEALRKEAEEKEKIDAPIAHTGGGVVGQMLPGLATMALGGGAAAAGTELSLLKSLLTARGIAGSAAAGAGAGALQPVTGEGQRGTNATVGAVLGAVPGVGTAAAKVAKPLVKFVANETPYLGGMLRAWTKRSARKAAEKAAAEKAITTSEKAARKSAADAEKAAKAQVVKEADEALGRKASTLSEGMDPTEAAAALRRVGIKENRRATRALDRRYEAAELPRPGVGDVDIGEIGGRLGREFKDSDNPLLKRFATTGEKEAASFTPQEVREARRVIGGQLSKLDPNSPKAAELRQLQSGLNESLESWGRTTPEARKQLRDMKAVDRLFRSTVGRARKQLGVRGTGNRVHEQDYPSVEKIITSLRSPNRAGDVADKVNKFLPGGQDELRRIVGALGTEDFKHLTGAAARRSLSYQDQDEIAALVKALRGQ